MLPAHILGLCLIIGSAVASPQFNPPPPKQEDNSRQFNPPPPKQEDLIEDDSVEAQSVEAEDFMAPMITENGHYQVDDMVFTEGQYKYHYGNEEEQRQAIPSATARWGNKMMPYAFDNSVSYSNKVKINQALKELNNALSGCIKVQQIKLGYSGNYVHVTTQPKGCYAYVGNINRGAQELNLQDGGCFSSSTIIHEFVHALGAFHVHSRDDRDKYVSINWSNIQQSQQHNFKKHANAPTFGTPYDPLSIMHYEHWAFGIDKSKPTIYSKMSNVPTNKLGTAEQLRDADIILLRKMYGCDLNYTTPPPPPCKNKLDDATCTKYAGWGVCKGQYYDYMLKLC